MTSRRELYSMGEPFGDSATRAKPGGRIYGGGGGGGPQTSETTQSIPDELKPLATAYSNKAMDLSNQSYNPYGGQRYADMNQSQMMGLGMAQDRALNGSSLMDAGGNWLQNMLQNGPAGATGNPMGGINRQQVGAGSNQYAGQNPFLEQQIESSIGDLRKSYMDNTLPEIASANVRSGSFGNSGMQEFEANKQRELAKQAGQISTGMRMQDYGMQQQLAESGLNRDMSAQMANLGTSEANFARGQDWAGRNDNMYQNYMGNSLNATGQLPTFGNQAYQDANALFQSGQAMQDQQQQGLDYGYQNYLDSQNLPYKQLAAMSGVFGSNLGSTSKTESTGGGGK